MERAGNVESLRLLIDKLLDYRYGVDYRITCIDREPFIETSRDYLLRLFEKIKIKSGNIVEDAASKTCILLIPLKTTSPDARFFKASLILFKLLSCSGRVEHFTFLDDLSGEFLLLVYVYSLLYSRGYEFLENMSIEELEQYVTVLFRFKDVRSRMKNLELELKRGYNEKLYEEYLVEVRELDKLMPLIKDLWLRNRELFDLLNDTIQSIDLSMEETVEHVLKNYEGYTGIAEKLRRLYTKFYNSMAEEFEVEINVLFVSNLLKSLKQDFVEKLIAINQYLEQIGCSSRIVVNGEELLVLKEVSRLDFTVFLLE